MRVRRLSDYERVDKRLSKGKFYKDNELTYAAYDRCLCGAGLAYPKKISPAGFWDCSAILKGEATPRGQPGSVKHEQRLPFIFWKVKSEIQPSARGATTRHAKNANAPHHSGART